MRGCQSIDESGITGNSCVNLMLLCIARYSTPPACASSSGGLTKTHTLPRSTLPPPSPGCEISLADVEAIPMLFLTFNIALAVA